MRFEAKLILFAEDPFKKAELILFQGEQNVDQLDAQNPFVGDWAGGRSRPPEADQLYRVQARDAPLWVKTFYLNFDI